jgi:hypothetical protein
MVVCMLAWGRNHAVRYCIPPNDPKTFENLHLPAFEGKAWMSMSSMQRIDADGGAAGDTWESSRNWSIIQSLIVGLRFRMPTARPSSLPVVSLTPSEVIKQRKVRVSLARHYRYAEANIFYCFVSPGQTNDREFPAWQFTDPVPELLQPVLLALQGALRTEVHVFLATARDRLNELAPAEVLAGTPFETRASLHPSQQRLLQLPANERRRRVLALIGGPGESMAG